jgi:hypothetical protein
VTCPSEGRLAAAVAGEDDGAADHAAACARCAAIVADGRAIRAALASLRAPSPRRQAAMLAEVLAEAERVASPRRATPRGGWRIAVAAVVVAAMVTGAAAGVGAVRRRVAAQRSMAVEVLRPAATPPRRLGAARATARAPGVSAVTPMAPVAVAPVAVVPVAPVAVVVPVAPVVAASADASSPVAAVVEPRRRAAPERASPVAPVAASSVAAPSVEASAPPSGVAAFRAGWEALRAGQPRVARAHFERADDPAVREDAAYWAAVASERAGERLEAARRFRGFAQAYPRSPRAADARAAAARLYDQ